MPLPILLMTNWLSILIAYFKILILTFTCRNRLSNPVFDPEICYEDVNCHGIRKLNWIERTTVLEITKSYKSIFTCSLLVLMGVPPIKIILALSSQKFKLINVHCYIENRTQFSHKDFEKQNLDFRIIH